MPTPVIPSLVLCTTTVESPTDEDALLVGSALVEDEDEDDGVDEVEAVEAGIDEVEGEV